MGAHQCFILTFHWRKSNAFDGRILWSDVGFGWRRLSNPLTYLSTLGRHLNSLGETSRWARKLQSALWSWDNYSQSMRNKYFCFEKKNGKDWLTRYISMSEICDSALIIQLLPASTFNQKSRKTRINVLNTHSLLDCHFKDNRICFRT